MASIHTLNARGNVMLPVLRDHFSWSNARTFKEIQQFHNDLIGILKDKNISYGDLRSALTPQTSKHEAAFLFDEQRCENKLVPGVECADALFRLLDPKATHSILDGELKDDKDEIARPLIGEIAVIAKDLNFAHPCYCYVLYVNNLSKESVTTIHEGLKAHKAYLGYVPCTYTSMAKTFVSLGLVNLAIKHKMSVILGHYDDDSNSDDCNLHLHDYTTLGLKIRSLQETYFSTFLSYKPERMLLDTVDDDLAIALSSMSNDVVPLTKFKVHIEDDKFNKYLQTDKRGKLVKAGIANLSKAQLEETIRQKLRMNYLYNMEWVDKPTHQLSKFNIMLEFPRIGGVPERLMVALEYKPKEKVLRLVTVA